MQLSNTQEIIQYLLQGLWLFLRILNQFPYLVLIKFTAIILYGCDCKGFHYSAPHINSLDS